LHEVVVEVAESKTGKTIYELRTMLFDPPSSTTPSDAGNRQGSRNSANRGGQR
jgi:hypothetical protein